jgi:hypothetical protein
MAHFQIVNTSEEEEYQAEAEYDRQTRAEGDERYDFLPDHPFNAGWQQGFRDDCEPQSQLSKDIFGNRPTEGAPDGIDSSGQVGPEFASSHDSQPKLNGSLSLISSLLLKRAPRAAGERAAEEKARGRRGATS